MNLRYVRSSILRVISKKSDLKKVEAAFPEYDVVGISAKYGNNMEEFYESLFKLAKKTKKR